MASLQSSAASSARVHGIAMVCNRHARGHCPVLAAASLAKHALHGTSADCKASQYLATHRSNLTNRNINTRFTIGGMEVGIAAIGKNLLGKRELELIQGLANHLTDLKRVVATTGR
ncbi:hypothetical protein [Paraburkholderia flagellata]|uniref:hypothetical protein n=1 Tax=Paraburkholderia flagellata TaxID=2883241 RepID=UPI001F35CB8D|nr:hypothetical protein [Paraburkholderia flagellata]